MKILIVEDDPVSRKILSQALERLGHEVFQTTNGAEAINLLAETPTRAVVSDWMMPGTSGLDLCRHIRARPNENYVYFILLTAQTSDRAHQREAIEAGVDDFLSKPLDPQELWMRLRVAERILHFTTQVQRLEEFLPICSYCKKIRDDGNYWQQIESYINERTGSEFSHSICPDCYQTKVVPELESLKKEKPAKPCAHRAK